MRNRNDRWSIETVDGPFFFKIPFCNQKTRGNQTEFGQKEKKKMEMIELQLRDKISRIE